MFSMRWKRSGRLGTRLDLSGFMPNFWWWGGGRSLWGSVWVWSAHTCTCYHACNLEELGGISHSVQDHLCIIIPYSGKFLLVLIFIRLTKIFLEFSYFLISYVCCGRLHACAADSAHTYVQYMVTLASLASLIATDADSGPLESEWSLRFDALAKNR